MPTLSVTTNANGWQEMSLGEFCEIYQPKTISRKQMIEDGEYPVFGANGVIGRYNEYNHENSELLITCRGATCGSVNVSLPKSWITGNAMVVRPDETLVLRRYLEYAFQGPINLSSVITGSAQPQITRTNLSPVRFAFPPLSEQQLIVNILDKAFAKIHNSKEQLEQKIHNANEFIKSQLQECFSKNIVSEIDHEGAFRLKSDLFSAKKMLLENGMLKKKKDDLNYPITKIPFETPDNWTWVYLTDVSIIQEGPGIRKFQYSSEGVQFLTVTNILEGSVDLEKSKKYISLEEYNQKYQHFTINKGDIVTACSGASWGKSAIFESEELLILNTSTLRLRFFNDLGVNKYLYYLTKTSYFKQRLSSHSTGQQPNYGYSHYSIIPIPLPPINEQVAISELLDSLFENTQLLKENYQLELTNYENLKQSILQEAFNGTLRIAEGLADES